MSEPIETNAISAEVTSDSLDGKVGAEPSAEPQEHPEDREAEEQLHVLMVETSTPGELFHDLVHRTGVYRDAP